MKWSKATWVVLFSLLLVNPILTTERFFYENLNIVVPPRGPLALRPVLEDADLKWEVWRPRLASIVSRCLGDEQRCQTRHWLGLTLRPGGEKELFFCSFFFSFISKREPFFVWKAPPLLSFSSNSPWFCCAFRFLSFTPRFTFLYWLPPFLFSPQIKTSGLLFLLSSSLSLGCWPVNLILSITTSKNYFCPPLQ